MKSPKTQLGDKGQKKKNPRRRDKLTAKEPEGGKSKTRKSRHQLAKERKAKAEREERLARKKAEEAGMNTELAGVEGLGVMATAHIYIPIDKKRKKLRVAELEEGTIDSEEELVGEYLTQSSIRTDGTVEEKKDDTQVEIKIKVPRQVTAESIWEVEEVGAGSGTRANNPDGDQENKADEQIIEDEKLATNQGDDNNAPCPEDPNLLKELAKDQLERLSNENSLAHSEVEKLRQQVLARDMEIESLKDEAHKQKTLLKQRQSDFDERLHKRTKNLEDVFLKELQEKMEICRKEAKAKVSNELKELREQLIALKNDQEESDSKGVDFTETLLATNKGLEEEVEQIKATMDETKASMDEIVTSKLQFVQKATAEIARLQQELSLSRLTEFRLQMEIRSVQQPSSKFVQSARKYQAEIPQGVFRSFSATQ